MGGGLGDSLFRLASLLMKRVKNLGILAVSSGLLIVFFLVLLLGAFVSPDWFGSSALIRSTTNFVTVITSFTQQALTRNSQTYPSKSQPEPIPFTCPTGNPPAPLVCSSTPPPPPTTTTTLSSNQALSTCPDYFRWIHEDLRPWKATGITRDMVDRAARSANFRLTVLGSRVYVERYRGAFQTRNVFTLWGILQLLRRYPGRVPDLDLAFNCDDMPVVRAANYYQLGAPAPPPLFRYCKDDSTLDIVFPDWSFWGWPEINIKPWEPLIRELKKGNEKTRWVEREPYAYWKGNPNVAWTRRDLLKCNVSNAHDWNARLYRQDWVREIRSGFKGSDLARQCTHRYKIYIEGRAWSVSEKYILACDSPTLLVKTRFIDFFTRGLVPGRHYWPIRDEKKCRSIKFAVDWGNAHQKEAQAMGKEASGFIQEMLKMDNVYDYMLHLLSEYSKLLRYKPTKPQNAVECCLESMACPVKGLEKKFMMDSIVKAPRDSSPCTMPPPFELEELEKVLASKANSTKQVELLEQRAWDIRRLHHC